ncbi:large ribosomal subunit protein bL21m [Panulirus ornatus]|uniref:large ribosomal subunit protein bL21m n=1 Tax=Panulirus ornatus TaxID=150431 RepID=UPI003A83AE36
MAACMWGRCLSQTLRFGNIYGNDILKQVTARLPLVSQVSGLRSSNFTPKLLQRNLQQPEVQQELVEDPTKAEGDFTNYIIEKVNNQIFEGNQGRLFAVVFVQGKQHLITPEDLVVVQGVFPPNIGDVIRMEKVLAVGGRDFTLFGRPVLNKDLVNIEATVVEKTLSHCRIFFKSIRRKNNRKTKFHRETHTYLRINRIEIMHKINEVQEVEGIDGRIF